MYKNKGHPLCSTKPKWFIDIVVDCIMVTTYSRLWS